MGSRAVRRPFSSGVLLLTTGRQGEVESRRLVEGGEEDSGDDADSLADALDGNGSDLFSLGLRVALESGVNCLEEYLERVHVGGVRGDGRDRDDASSEPHRGSVGAVVADDYGRSPLVGFCANLWLEVDHADLAPAHQPSPSAVAFAQSTWSSLSAHSVHA